jgi:hypothetical protein
MKTGIKTQGELRCPNCGQITNDRVMTLSKSMVKALTRVYIYAKEKDKHEFNRKEIEFCFKTLTEKATFGDWIYFSGGLVYKPSGRGSWGINMERTAQFLKGTYRLPIRIVKSRANSEITVVEEGTIKDVRDIGSFLSEQGDFIARYV